MNTTFIQQSVGLRNKILTLIFTNTKPASYLEHSQ